MKRKLDLTAAGYVFYQNKLLLIYHSKLNMWLPPGGHIENNETPDEAVMREILEETSLNVRVVSALQTDIPQIEGNKKTAIPFFTNIHSVGDHDHYGACYLCESDNDLTKTNNETKGLRWLTKEEVSNDPNIRSDIKAIALAAFEHYNLQKP